MSTDAQRLVHEHRHATPASEQKASVEDVAVADLHALALCGLAALADRRLDRLARHLATRLEQPLSLAKAAELCALETTYFSRYFRSRTGANYTDWYRQLRIERAKALLLNQCAKVDGVADAVGYKNITTFERAFRRCTGLSPVEYRKSLRPPRKFEPQNSPSSSQGTTTGPQRTPTR
jgi:transcriptional regulator GlxA family with amidase domain